MAAKTDRIELRHLHRTRLDEIGIKTIIERFTDLEHKVVVSFDKKLALFEGLYVFDYAKRHYIKLAVNKFCGLESKAQEYNYISSLLHELCHAQQCENLKEVFHSRAFSRAKGTTDQQTSYWYADRELEARIYADTHLKSAMEVYRNACAKVPNRY